MDGAGGVEVTRVGLSRGNDAALLIMDQQYDRQPCGFLGGSLYTTPGHSASITARVEAPRHAQVDHRSADWQLRAHIS